MTNTWIENTPLGPIMHVGRKGRYELFDYLGRLIGDTFAASAHDAAARNPGAYYAKVWDRYGADGRPLTAGRR